MHTVLSSSSLTNDNVYDREGTKIGALKEIMLDADTGRIAYGVLSFGGFLGFGDKLFALPWSSITVDTANKRIIADVSEKQLEKAEGFDKDHWPNFADNHFRDRIYTHWDAKPYWA